MRWQLVGSTLGTKTVIFQFFGRFGIPRPFDLSTEGVALSHQGACICEVRNFCHWASCRDPNLLNWDLGRTSPWTPMESTDPLNSGGCDSSRLGSPNGRSCKLPVNPLRSSTRNSCRRGVEPPRNAAVLYPNVVPRSQGRSERSERAERSERSEQCSEHS